MLWFPRKAGVVGGKEKRSDGCMWGYVWRLNATLSHERGFFDLIIWDGQSAFVVEESL